MIINGNYYQTTGENYSADAGSVDSLSTHLRSAAGQGAAELADSVTLSPEALAALKEYAPEALSALGFQEENPVLEEVKEIAKEKYFHFGSQYLSIPDTTEEMVSALDVATRYMDALNSIEPDEIYEAITGSNISAAESGSVESLQEYIYG